MLPQITELVLENLGTKQQVKVKVLFDAGFQRIYIFERICKFLNLSVEAIKDVYVSTFKNVQTLSKYINLVSLVVGNNSLENILIKELCLPMLRLPKLSPSITILRDN